MPLIPNKREFLARRLRDAGVLRLIERAAAKPGLLVLTYHRVGTPEDYPEDYAPILSATPDAFREQVARLRDTFRVLSLAEVVALAGSGFPLKEPSALVTFDDGYRDNFEVALPVLNSLNVPAAFFLPTGFLQAPRLPWWDHVARVVNRARPTGGVLRLDRPEPLEVVLASRPAAVARVIRACLDHDVDVNDERGFLDHLEDRAEVRLDTESLGRSMFMTWDQARGLLDSGMAVGSHAHSHRALARLSAAEQRDELAGSRAVLERELGRGVDAVAYPYGWAGAYDALTARLAREAGYALGFASVEGANRPGATDPFAVRRLGVGFADTPVLLRARLALHAATGRSFL